MPKFINKYKLLKMNELLENKNKITDKECGIFVEYCGKNPQYKFYS